MNALTFGSLFAGIGGFDLGFERAGMVCKWQVEIDDYATRVLEKHWPDVRRFRDVRECGAANLERVDVICGGFPCQDISYAGNGAGLAGERSGLFFEVVRIAREMGPRFLVLENVSALLTRGIDQVLGTLASIGFDAEWHCIPAAFVGAPHIRDRVFIVGVNSNSEKLWRDGGIIIEHSRERRQQRAARGLRRSLADSTELHGNGGELHQEHAECKISESGNSGFKEDGRGQWSVEPDVGRVADGIPDRVDRLKCLGNAVVPQVAEWIGRRIVEAEQARSDSA